MIKSLLRVSWQLDLIQKSDQIALFEVLDENRTYLRKWLPFVSTITSEEDLDSFIDFVTKPKEVEWSPVFLIKSDNKIIGLIGFKNTNLELKHTEIGYWLVEHMQGHGIITSALKELLRFAFLKMEMRKIIVKCGLENFPSRRIPSKLGFKIDHIEPMGEQMANGDWIDLVHYVLDRNDYPKNSKSKYS
ncbi:GNAT family N-acetyltransferase [Shivajiella indica]|uniref:GNAT family N-acetyltransferase n=1 Tax=Shivajiella indica TaxID=872115 RepID=A0ABW5B7T4_9BACT